MEIKKNTIKTKRLILSPYSQEDVNALSKLFQNESITKTFMVPLYEKEEDYLALAQKIISFSSFEDTKHLELGIYYQNTLIGFLNDCGFDDTTIEIGYVIHPDYWGKGFATEAVSALLPQLKSMGFEKVIAGYFVENEASFRVMQKIGMQKTNQVEIVTYRGKEHTCHYLEINLNELPNTFL